MKKISTTMVACLLPLFLSAQKNFSITGKINHPAPSSLAYLSYAFDGLAVLDSSVLKDGKFIFKGKLKSPVTAKIRIRHASDQASQSQLRDVLSLYLEPGNIKITAYDSIGKASISGSKLNDDNRTLNESLKATRKQMALLKNRHPDGPRQKNDVVYQKVQDSIAALNAEEMKITTEFIATHTDSYVALLAFARSSVRFGFDPLTAKKGFSQFSAATKASTLGITIQNQILSAKNTQLGKVAMNFTQNDPRGKAVYLSDFQGKYILLDFWASWCGPCRAENPNVVKAYEQLKGKNFEIIGISLDEKSDPWLNAIAKDGLPWVHLSDLKGWRNEVAIKYGISAVPQNFLIDPKGLIIGKNLRAEELYEKIMLLMQ